MSPLCSVLHNLVYRIRALNALLSVVLFAAANALLPHLYTFHCHAFLVTCTPGRVPLSGGFPELSGSSDTGVSPWLIADAVGEETIGGANSDVEDQVKGLVEGSVCSSS